MKMRSSFKASSAQKGKFPTAESLHQNLNAVGLPILKQRAEAYVETIRGVASRSNNEELSSAVKQLRVVPTNNGYEVTGSPGVMEVIRKFEYGNETQPAIAITRKAQDQALSGKESLRADLKNAGRLALKKSTE